MIEFHKEDDVKNILSTCGHIDDLQAVPVYSSFLWFRVSANKKSLSLPKSNKLDVENGTKIPSNETIVELLKKADSVRIILIFVYT